LADIPTERTIDAPACSGSSRHKSKATVVLKVELMGEIYPESPRGGKLESGAAGDDPSLAKRSARRILMLN